MNKYEIMVSGNEEFPYNVRILTSEDGGENYYYSGNGRYCKTLEEAAQFIKNWEKEVAGVSAANVSAEEVIDKSFGIVEEFYQHLTEASQPITEQDISNMQWVLNNIVPAIKMDKENHLEIQDDEFGKCDGWSHGYSNLMILGATRQQVIKQAKTRDDWENIFLNYIDCSDGSIALDAYRIGPKEAADFFCEIGPSVRVYASWHWDEDEFAARCNNEDYHGFTAKFAEGTPRDYDDEDGYYDVEVEITDKDSGCKFVTGGGMCTEEEMLAYCKLVSKHSK